MAFTFDFTLKGVNSNSYVPLESYIQTSTGRRIVGADDYFAGHPKSDKWDQLTELQKQQFLVRATSRLDLELWGGRRSDNDQRLQFPRAWLVSRDHDPSDAMLDFVNGKFYQSADYLPIEIENATFELALFYVEEWLNEDPLFSRNDMERMENVSIGPLTAKLRKTREDSLPDIVVRLLRGAGPNVWQGGKGPKVVR
jgi:hypothetical protein